MDFEELSDSSEGFDDSASVSEDDDFPGGSFAELPDDEAMEVAWTPPQTLDAAASGLNALVRLVAARTAASRGFAESASDASSLSELDSDWDDGDWDDGGWDDDGEDAAADDAPWPRAPPLPPGTRDAVEAECSCPITHALMLDPVLASDGVVYEREAIERWIATALGRGARRVLSPLTRAPLKTRRLAPVRNLARLARAAAEREDADAELRADYAARCVRRALRHRDAAAVVRAKAVWGGGAFASDAELLASAEAAGPGFSCALKLALSGASPGFAEALSPLQRSWRARRSKRARRSTLSANALPFFAPLD